jgi:hypothetical protein
LHLISRPVSTSRPRHDDLGDGFNTSLPREICAILVDMLRQHTATPDACWFAVWEGLGGLDNEGVIPRIQHPGRDYLLATGPIEDAVPHLGEDAPNIWWPEDRAWIVVSEIDYAWTYVAGSVRLIDTIVRLIDTIASDPRLEALPARLSDRPFYDGDVLNAALDPPEP